MIPENKKCPRCANILRTNPHSDRTVKGGTWWVRRCSVCGYVEDVFVPRRGNMKAQTD